MPAFGAWPRLVACAAAALLIVVCSIAIGGGRISADTYEVQPGDTLSGIAGCLNVSASVIQALNLEIDSPDRIFVGQRIRVPDNADSVQPGCSESNATEPQTTASNDNASSGNGGPIGAGACVHLVQPGDFLGAIALRYGTDTATMIALNPSIHPDILWEDQQLSVPCSAAGARKSQSQPTQGGQSDDGDDLLEEKSDSSATTALTAGFQAERGGAPITRVAEYTVERGDSATAIAIRFGISLQQLQDYNPLADFNVIHPGDILFIPIPNHLAPALEPSEALGVLTGTYTVRSGDYASKIAEMYGITLGELRELNGGESLRIIGLGQTLTVPWVGTVDAPPGTVPAVEVRRRSYRVQRGDTFMGIATAHGLSLGELRALNPHRPSDLLVIDELIHLPGVIDPPVVAEDRTLPETDLVQYAAATLGVTPHTLLANYSWLDPEQWLEAGTSWRLPLRDGLLITVRPGDTLQGIASAHGIDMSLILADPANGVDDPNAIVIGQELIIPLAIPDFHWPAQGEMTDPFGLCRSWDCSYRHRGLDLAMDYYVPIVAAADGLVTFVGGDADFGLGWYVEIEHEGGWRTTYAHLVEFAVFQGQPVERGQTIGYNGNTGYSTGPHLHFEVRHHDWYIDPLVVLP